jgi:hypothetical protein
MLGIDVEPDKKRKKKKSFSFKRKTPNTTYPNGTYTLYVKIVLEDRGSFLYMGKLTKTWRMACSVGAPCHPFCFK